MTSKPIIDAQNDLLFEDNITGNINALDGRTAFRNTTGLAQQGIDMATGATEIANTSMNLGDENKARIDGLDTKTDETRGIADQAISNASAVNDRIDEILEGNTEGLTPEQIAANKLQRDANTAFATAQAPLNAGYRSDIEDLKIKDGTQDTAIGEAQTRADNAFANAGTATTTANNALASSGTNRTNLTNHIQQEFIPLRTRVTEAESKIGTEGAVGQQGTGILGDVKALKETDDDIIERLDEVEVGTFTPSDLRTAHGFTNGFTPGISYRGTGSQEYFDANQATIPGLIKDMATGQFTIDAISLTADDGTAIPAGTRINLTQAYLNPGRTGTTNGSDPIFYIQMTQGDNVLLGAGNAGDTTDLARNWHEITDLDSITELSNSHGVTGEDIIVHWAIVYTGLDATLRPSLSRFTISFTGQYEPIIEQIVHGVVDGEFQKLKDADARAEGTLASIAVEAGANKRNVESNTDAIHTIQDTLNEPQFEAIDNASIVPVETQTLDATALNTELGGGTNPFAKRLDDAITNETGFFFQFDSANKFFEYGGGQIARVIGGRLIIYELIPGRDASTATNTRYITTPDGLGTRTRPAVLELGILRPGQTARSPLDSEVLLNTGVPPIMLPDGTTISNLSMAFGLRTNNNWNGISDTIQLTLRSGQPRDFQIPNVENVTFTATAQTNGFVLCRATHLNGGNANAVVTNGAAIRFDCGYTETVITPARDPGQASIDAGAFTGNELIGIDVGSTGDHPDQTAMVFTPTRTYNTGYFIREEDRLSIRTDNEDFRVYATTTPLTQDIMSRLDGTDRQYLGLYARTNHHGDALQLINGLVVPTSDGTMTYNVGDSIKRLEDIPTGTGLSETKAREIATEVINNSLVIQANTAKSGVTTADRANLNRIDGIASDVARNNAKVGISTAQASAIQTNTAKVGVDEELLARVQINTDKISYTAEDKAITTKNTQRADYHDTQFGATIHGNWPSGMDLVSLDNVTELSMGDLVTQGDTIYEALQDITSIGSSFAPDASPNSWRKWEVQTQPYDDSGIEQLKEWKVADTYSTGDYVGHATGIYRTLLNNISGTLYEPGVGQIWSTGFALVANNYTDALAKAQAEGAIGEALAEDGAIATYVKDNAGDEIDESVLADEGSCTLTGEDTSPASSVSFSTLNLTCNDPEAPVDGNGFVTGLVTITSDTIFTPTTIRFTNPRNSGVTSGTIGDGMDDIARVISGAGTTRQVIQIGDRSLPGSGFVWGFSGNPVNSALRVNGDGMTNATASFAGHVSVPGTQGVLRDRAIEIAQRYGASGSQLLEISDTETNQFTIPSSLIPGSYATETIAVLPIPAISDRFETYRASFSGVISGTGATIRFFYSDDNEAIASFTTQLPRFDIGIIDITRPISVGLLAPAFGLLAEGELIGESRGTLREQDIINAQEVFDAGIDTELAVGGKVKTAIDAIVTSNGGYTDTQAKAQANEAINESLVIQANTAKPTETRVNTLIETGITNSLIDGGDIATYVADNAGSDGISLEAIANEMRADGDEAIIPIGTFPQPLQAETDMVKDRDIIVPDNALFRTPSTIRFLITSSVINTGNNVPVSLIYTDDNSIASGQRPALTDGTTEFTFRNIDLTRPIAFRVGTTVIQTITFTKIDFENTKTGDGSLVNEIQQVVLDQVAGDVTFGGDPIMGGGARYRTFYRDIPASSITAGSTQNFIIPSALDAEVTYLTWACMVLTPSTTSASATLWGGDIGASANDRGAVSINLENRGDGGSHSFGIARQTHGNAVRIASLAGTVSDETVIRVSITLRQGAPLKLPE